jgi:hypothetical protein
MVEIIPKPPEKTPFWQNLILFLSIVILIAAVFGYFILGSLQKKANQQLEEIRSKIAQTETPERNKLKTSLLVEKKKIDDFTLILNKHQISSVTLLFLEKITHPRVWFSTFNLDLAKGTIGLSGETESFITLGQQEVLFQLSGEVIKQITGQEILKTDLSQILIGKEGKIGFNFNLSFGNPTFK